MPGKERKERKEEERVNQRHGASTQRALAALERGEAAGVRRRDKSEE
jgi:hypothetical protein